MTDQMAEVNKVLSKGIDELSAEMGDLADWVDEEDGDEGKIIDFPGSKQ
jgi:hypothetical protein